MSGEEHRVQVFSEGGFVNANDVVAWGWQCFTCGAEETGFGNATTAADAADNHEALP